MSETEIKAAVDGASTTKDDDGIAAELCPVTALGHRGKIFYYRTAAGELYDFSLGEHTVRGLLGLMCGDTRWLFNNFPRRNANGDVTGWLDVPAAAFLMRQCGLVGFFNPARQVRGPGVWVPQPGADNEPVPVLVVHSGDALWFASKSGETGSWRAAGTRVGDILYAASPAERRPADKALSISEAHEICAYLEKWNWRAPKAAPRLLLGWICAGYLAGALRWRSHVWIIGDLGTGKSTLEQGVENLFGDVVMRASAPTPASLWQSLSGAARQILLDEIEYDAADPKAAAVVKVARMASTHGQGGLMRGSAEGKASAYHVVASFYCTSIYMPPLEPQDQTRFTVLELDPLQGGAEAAAAARRGLTRMAILGPRLYRRMVDRFELVQANLEVYAQAFSASGHDNRFADQVGTLLAAADAATSDHVVELDTALAFIRDAGVVNLAEPEPETGHELCLNRLLSSALPSWRHGRVQTVGQVLVAAIGGPQTDAARELTACGISVDYRRRGGGYWVLIANRNAQLEAIFAGSRWAGIWDQALRRTPGSERGGPGRFGATTSRFVALPLGAFPGIKTPDPPRTEEDARREDATNFGT